MPQLLQDAAALAWRVLAVVLAIGVVVWVLAQLRVVVIPVVLALFASAILAPPAGWLRERHVPRGIATLIVVVAALALVSGFVVWTVPRVAAQVPDFTRSLTAGIAHVQRWLETGPLQLSPSQVNLSNVASSIFSSREVASRAIGGVSLVTELIAEGILAFILTIYFVNDGDRMFAWFVSLFRGDRAAVVEELGRRSWESIAGYIRGTTINGVINGSMMAAGLLVLGVPLVLPLAILTFFGAYLPILGAILAGAVAALIALVSKGVVTAAIVVGITIFIHQFEGNVLAPLVLGHTVRLHPVAVLLALSSGTVIGGIAGAMLAVPVLGVLVAWAGFYRHRILIASSPPSEQPRPGPHHRTPEEAGTRPP